MSMKLGFVIGATFKAGAAFASSEKALKSLNKYSRQLNQRKLKIKTNTRGLDAVNAKLKVVDRAITKLNRRKVKMDKIIQGRNKFKSSLTDKLVLAGAVIAPLKVAIDFESAMADVKKVVNFQPGEANKFQNEITKLSKTIPIAATGLAEIAASGGQLGIAKNKLIDFTTTTAKMSTAFDMMPNQAGEASAALMNVFGLNVKGVELLGDAINHLSDNSAAKASGIINVVSRIAGSAKVFGLSEMQSTSLAGAFLALGKSPEVAATGINALLLKLGTAEKQGAKFQEALALMGLSSEQLKQDISEHGEQAIFNFLEQINEVDNTNKMGVLSDLFGAEYADDIALLSGGIDNYTKSIKLLSNEQDFAGSMQREFEARSKTTANNLILLKNATSTISINLGTVLLPAINNLITPLAAVSGWVGDLAARFPILSGLIAGLPLGVIFLSLTLSALGYASGFVISGFLKLGNAITLLKAGFALLKIRIISYGIAAKFAAVGQWLLNVAVKTGSFALTGIGRLLNAGKLLAFSAATKVAAAGQWLLNVALNANPIGLVVAGVAALAAGIVYAYKNFKPFTNLVDSLWSGFKNLFDFILSGWNKVGGVISSIASVFGQDDDKKSSNKTPNLSEVVRNNENLSRKTQLSAVASSVLLASSTTLATPTLPTFSKLPLADIQTIQKQPSPPAQVNQSNTIHVQVNNPASTVDVENGVTNAMANHGSNTSLMDEDI